MTQSHDCPSQEQALREDAIREKAFKEGYEAGRRDAKRDDEATNPFSVQ